MQNPLGVVLQLTAPVEMPVLSVLVMLNHPPYCQLVSIDPASAKIADLVTNVIVWLGGEEKRSTIRLRWIVDEVSPWVFE